MSRRIVDTRGPAEVYTLMLGMLAGAVIAFPAYFLLTNQAAAATLVAGSSLFGGYCALRWVLRLSVERRRWLTALYFVGMSTVGAWVVSGLLSGLLVMAMRDEAWANVIAFTCATLGALGGFIGSRRRLAAERTDDEQAK